MSVAATDTGGFYNDDDLQLKKKKKKSKKQKHETTRGVEHYREYSPQMPPPDFDFLMNPFDRPTSEQLTDLHVYIVPPEYWDDQHNCAFNTVMNFTTSVGFIRVYPETRLSDLRAVLIDQVTQSGGMLPYQFVFLKSVGRALTLVKDQQETQLKVKNFLPPFAYAPELFLMTRDRIMEPGKRGKRKEVPPLGQAPQHRYVPMHHAQQAAAASSHRYAGMQPGYPPPSHQSQYRGGPQMGGAGGGMYGYGGQSMGPQGQYQNPYESQRGRQAYPMTPSMNPQHHNMGYPTHRTNYTLVQPPQNVSDNRVFPPKSNFYPGFEGFQPANRVGYPMDYGTPMSGSPPETAMMPQGYNVDPVPLSLDPNQRGVVPNPQETRIELESEQNRATTSESESSDAMMEVSLEERERVLERQERELERKRDEKERKLEEKMRQTELQQQQSLRDLEKRLAEEQRKMEDSKYQMERDLQDQKDRQEKALGEMRRNLERQQQQDQYKRQKEMDELLREQEKKFGEKQRETEKILREQEKELRLKFAEEEKKLAEKEREIERAKMELEKQQLEREKQTMQKQNYIQKAKMEMKREKQALAKEEKEQLKTERAEAISRNSRAADEGSSRPGSSPAKMKFPRAKTPDLLEEFQKKLLELARIKEERKEIELVRDDLIRKAHSVQTKAAQKRAQARDNWKKQYFEEKKKTLPLEEHAQKMRREVDNLNRRILNRLEKEADAQKDQNQQLASQHKIVYMKLQYELDEAKQKIEELQMKLFSEIKRRIQCQRETRCLHRELRQTRITANLEPVNPPPDNL